MSSTWYGIRAYFKSPADAQHAKTTLLPEPPSNDAAEAMLQICGATTAETNTELSSFYLESSFVTSSAFHINMQASTSSFLPSSLIKTLARLNARFIKVDVFNDQVCESDSFYFQGAKRVDVDDILDQLIEFEPGIKFEQLLEEDLEDEAIELLNQGADPNTRICGESVLQYALEHSHDKLAEALVVAGASLSTSFDEEFSALHQAISSEYLNVVKAIITAGADVNSQDENGDRPLQRVPECSENKLEIFERLLAAGADPLVANDEYGSILWQAYESAGELIEPLEKLGAPIIPPLHAYNGDADDDLLVALLHNDKPKLKQLSFNGKIKKRLKKPLLTHFAYYGNWTLMRAYFPDFSNPFMRVDDEPLLATALNSHHTAFIDWLTSLINEDSLPKSSQVLQEVIERAETSVHLSSITQALLRCGVSLSALETDGEPLLHSAVRCDDKAFLSFLLAQGIDPNQTDEENRTALHIECGSTETAWATQLLAAGADVNAQDEDDDTPLHLASSEGNTALVEVLLTHKADPNIKGDYSMTPLMRAAQHGHRSLCEQLIEYGANPHARDEDGDSPYALAKANDHIALAKWFKQFESDLPIEQQVWHAIDDDEPDQLEAASHSINLADLSDEDGRTVLHRAVTKGSCKVLNILTKAVDDIDTPDKDGNTALALAVQGDKFKPVKALLNAGASPNARVAIVEEEPDEEDSLLKALGEVFASKASKDAEDDDEEEDLFDILSSVCGPLELEGNDTPSLSYAAQKGDYKSVQCLLDHQADPALSDDEGWTPLIYAIYGGSTKAVSALLAAGVEPNCFEKAETQYSALHLAAYRGKAKIIKLLIDSGAKVDAREQSEQQTPLHIAACSAVLNGKKSIKMLIKAGCDLDAQDKDGMSALMWSIEGFAFEAAQLLKQAGANPDLVDNSGKTARDYATEQGEEFNELFD